MSRRSLDLRGTPCPVNFIRCKLTLEQMSSGDCLEVCLEEDGLFRGADAALMRSDDSTVFLFDFERPIMGRPLICFLIPRVKDIFFFFCAWTSQMLVGLFFVVAYGQFVYFVF